MASLSLILEDRCGHDETHGSVFYFFRLFAREDGSQRVCLAGLTETEVKDETSLMQVRTQLFKSK